MESAHRLAQAYKESVERALGAVARLERGTNVVFRHPRCGLMVIFVKPSEPGRFQLVLPAFLHSQQGLSRPQMLELCNLVNGHVHGVKFAVDPGPRGEVSGSVELLMPLTEHGDPHPELLDGIVRRSINMLLDAAHGFGRSAVDAGLRPTSGHEPAARGAQGTTAVAGMR